MSGNNGHNLVQTYPITDTVRYGSTYRTVRNRANWERTFSTCAFVRHRGRIDICRGCRNTESERKMLSKYGSTHQSNTYFNNWPGVGNDGITSTISKEILGSLVMIYESKFRQGKSTVRNGTNLRYLPSPQIPYWYLPMRSRYPTISVPTDLVW